MIPMGLVHIHCFPDDDALAAAAAAAWLDAIVAARVADHGFSVALSGGRVMRKFLVAAATRTAAGAGDISQVHFFWADERCVPPDDAESNFRLANEALLRAARVPDEHVHRLRGEAPPATAALTATREMREFCRVVGEGMPALDLVLLGMGEDGHVASLFPGDLGTDADVTSVFLPVLNAPKPPPHRLSLGHGPIAAARAVWVLASGTGKQAALLDSLAKDGSTPLARVIQGRALTTVFTDIGWCRTIV